MSEYTFTLGASVFILFVIYVTGAGAGEYLDVDDDSDPELDVDDDPLDIDLSNATLFRDTYYDSSDDSVKVNESEADDSVFDPPAVRYDPEVEDMDAIEVDAEVKDGARLRFGQGTSIREVENGTNTYENFDEDNAGFSITWQNDDDVNKTATYESTIEDVRLLPDSDVQQQNFINNVSELLSLSTGNTFVDQVILGSIFIVLALVVLSVTPFFG